MPVRVCNRAFKPGSLASGETDCRAAQAPGNLPLHQLQHLRREADPDLRHQNTDTTVGAYYDKNLVGHGFLLTSDLRLTIIDGPNGRNTQCFGINHSSVVVGYYFNAPHQAQAFVYQSGTFTDLPIASGAFGSEAYGINDKGYIVGAYQDSGNNTNGFICNGNSYTQLTHQARSAPPLLGLIINSTSPCMHTTRVSRDMDTSTRVRRTY